MSEPAEIRIDIRQESDFAFRIEFLDTALAPLHSDEPAPLGKDSGPNPSRLLLAAVGNCLAASLLFALRKFHHDGIGIRALVRASLQRNDAGRWRLPRAQVELQLDAPAAGVASLDRILAQFEEFCVVTQSVRQGIEVEVSVRDGDGVLLRGAGTVPGP